MSFALVLVAVVAAVIAQPAEYFYADYDNIVVTANDTLFYLSALTQEAVERTQQGSAAVWLPPVRIPVSGLYNAKGVVFCGNKSVKSSPGGGKFGQLFVADEGTNGNAGMVIGWDVGADPTNPAGIKLFNKWDVLSNTAAMPSDVECGPNNGLFIADKGNGAIYWVSGADLEAKKLDAWAPVVPKECGGAVAAVRSLAYDAVNGQLLWTNNDEVVVENSGVFAYSLPADLAVAPVNNCDPPKCSPWSDMCSSKIKMVVPVAKGEKAWAIADAWGNRQVSKGGKEVYNQTGEKVAEVPQEATYVKAANDDKRDVLLVIDAKLGAVFACAQNSTANKVADVPNPFGVAYNNGFGHAATVTMSPTPRVETPCQSAALSCSGELAVCVRESPDQCPCYAAHSICLEKISVGVCQKSAQSVANAETAALVCSKSCNVARCSKATTTATTASSCVVVAMLVAVSRFELV